MVAKFIDAINTHWQSGRHDDALAVAEALASQHPHAPHIIATHGCALFNCGHLEEAEHAFLQAAIMHWEAGHKVQADECWGLILQTRGQNDAQGWLELSGDFLHSGQNDLAEAICWSGWSRYPDESKFSEFILDMFRKSNNILGLISAYEKILENNPNSPNAHYNLATLYVNCNRAADGFRHLQKINLDQLSPDGELSVLKGFIACYTNGGLGAWQDTHRIIDRAIEIQRLSIKTPLPPKPSLTPISGRPLRIGWCCVGFGLGLMQDRVIRDFVSKIVAQGHFCPVYALAIHPNTDLHPDWIDLSALPAEQAAERVRQDQLDCLVTLDFVPSLDTTFYLHRPAPVILSFLHGLGNQGGAVDGILTDKQMVPPKEAYKFNEKILYLRRGSNIILEEGDVPKPTRPPSLDNGYITFGSFNRSAKITPDSIALWSKALHATQNSKMIMRSHTFSEWHRMDILKSFEEHGISNDRVTILGWAPLQEFLSGYDQLDIAFDPLSFGGGITSCQALCHGVPVVTLPGETVVSRIGASILHAGGVPQWCAQDEEDWLRIVLSLANNPDELSYWRKELYGRMQKSTLLNADMMAEDFLETIQNFFANPAAS